MKKRLQLKWMMPIICILIVCSPAYVSAQIADQVSTVNTWATAAFTEGTQTGEFTIEFDMVPEKDIIDGVTGLTPLSEATTYSDLSVIVRFSGAGMIDAYDNSGYKAENELEYGAGISYHVRIEVNTSQMMYDVYVTEEGETEITIAKDYTFRNKKINLSSLALVAGDFNIEDPGTHTVSNIALTEISQNANPVFAAIADQKMNGGTLLEVAVAANDPMDAAVTLTATSIPSFANFTDNGDGTGVVSLTPAQDDSEEGDYTLELAASNGTESGSVSFQLRVNPYVPIVTVEVDAADVDIFFGTFANDPAKPFVWTGAPELLIGGGSNHLDPSNDVYDMAAVMPFMLPIIPEGQELTSASMSANLNQVVSWAWQDYDLYGIDYRAAATVLGTDYFQGVYGTDATATAIQQKWAEGGGVVTPVGLNVTSEDGSAALLEFLKKQYTDGAVGGEFVFLRVSLNVLDAPTFGRLDIDSQESGNGATLNVTFGEPNVAPVIDAIEDQAVIEERSISIALSATDENSVDVLAFSLGDNTPDFITLTDNKDGTGSLAIDPENGDDDVYTDVTVNVTDGLEVVSATFTLTVSENGIPALQAIGDQTLKVGETLSVLISATDSDQDGLTYTLEGAPSFVTLVDNTDGTATLDIDASTASEGASENIVISVTDGFDTASETISVIVETLTLSTSDQLYTIGFYPNPTSDLLHIEHSGELRGASLTIYDLTGSQVMRTILGSSSEISVNELKKGRYIINLVKGDLIQTASIIKK